MTFSKQKKTDRDYQLESIMLNQLSKITESPDKWTDFLKQSGYMYRFSYPNKLLIHAQRPDATFAAPYHTWKSLGRHVRRGTKGIAIFPEHSPFDSERPFRMNMKHVHDLSDTGGRKHQITWQMDKKQLSGLLNYIAENKSLNDGNFTEITGYEALANQHEKSYDEQKDLLKSFTETYVRGIMKEKYADEANQLDGAANEFIHKSIMYTIASRCGFSLTDDEKDFSNIRFFRDEVVTSLILIAACGTSKEFLENIYDTLKIIHIQNKTEGRNDNDARTDLHNGDGRNPLPGHQPAAGSDGRTEETRQVRQNDSGISDGTQDRQLHDAINDGETSRQDEGSGQKSGRNVEELDSGVPTEPSAETSGIKDRIIQTSETSRTPSRGNHHQKSSEAVSLEAQIQISQTMLGRMQADIRKRDAYQKDNPDFAITIGDTLYTKRKDGGIKLMDAANTARPGEMISVGSFKGFQILLEKTETKTNLILRSKGGYSKEMSLNPVGNMIRLENLLNSLEQKSENLEKQIEDYKSSLASKKSATKKEINSTVSSQEKPTENNSSKDTLIAEARPIYQQGKSR